MPDVSAIAAVLSPFLALIPAAEPTWTAFLVLGLLGGLLALDETALAQTWFSQPLPAGLLTGALCGDPLTGLAIGLPVQLILAGNIPVGQTFTGDAVAPMVAAVGAVSLSGLRLSPALSGAGSDLLPLIGWTIVGIGIFSSAGHFTVQLERRVHSLWMREGHRTLRDGRLHRVERIHIRCLVATFLRGVLVTIVLLIVLRRVWLPLFEHLPGLLHGALAMMPLLLPGLAVGNLIDRFGLRAGWLWISTGAAVGFVATRFWL